MIRLLMKLMAMFVALVALLWLLILFVSSSITSPLTTLVEQARRYADGRFDRPLTVTHGPLEIVELLWAPDQEARPPLEPDTD
jgi:nitrate/nitrite-specific signal transduction histidine kinase